MADSKKMQIRIISKLLQNENVERFVYFQVDAEGKTNSLVGQLKNEDVLELVKTLAEQQPEIKPPLLKFLTEGE